MKASPKKATKNPDDRLREFRKKQTTVSKKTAEAIVEAYPILKNNVAFRSFFFYLAKGYHVIDPKTGLHIIPYEVVATFAGPAYKNTGDFLIAYRREVAPHFTFKNYSHQYKRCRQIITTGVPEIVEDIMTMQDRVYVDSFKVVTRRSKEEATREMKAIAKTLIWVYTDARKIAEYHLGHRLAAFLDPMEEHYQRGMQVASAHSVEQITLLSNTHDMPLPIYRPTAHSPRPFAEGLQFMKKEVRKVLYPHWKDVDLKNCQLAIVAAIFNIRSIQSFLETGAVIWDELISWMSIPAEQKDKAKPWIKKALYSIIFGKKGYLDERELETCLHEEGVVWQNRFIDHPLMKDLSRAVSLAKRNIIKRKGMQTAYGWKVLPENRDIDSFLAECIQTYELKLIMPIYTLAAKEKKNNNETFYIMLHQHDGISYVLCPDQTEEQVFAKMKKAVSDQAKKFDIITTLVKG